jgi:hypothetical protein
VALVIAGALCSILVSGGTGEALTMALAGSGLVFLTGLVFLEIGLSEDRDRAKERGGSSPAPPRRLERMHAPRLRGSRHER